MTEIIAQSASPVHPAAPLTLADTGLAFDLVTELVLKTLHRVTDLSGSEVARRLGLGFGIIEPSLDLLKAQRHCEITGGPTLGGASFRYRLTDSGHTRAIAAFERNGYLGVAPIPVAHYQQYMLASDRLAATNVTPDDVRAAFAHLVVSDRVLDEIGPAVNAGQSIFIYGPPGNGKTVMAHAIRALLKGHLAIPHALEVGGQIVRFFDPTVHEPVTSPSREEPAAGDRRWIVCRRPMVVVGGELTLEALALAYNPRSGIYYAPVQALANGGVLLVDDFGRQRCSPRDLLNWWMVPLESHAECLTLQSGEKLEMPFLALVIFSTNLNPSELVDEAFLRRIPYKIYAEGPTPERFVQIFERYCRTRRIAFSGQMVLDLLAKIFEPRGIELRACHPRDLVDQALALASYRGLPRQLTPDLLVAACRNYFIDDREARRP